MTYFRSGQSVNLRSAPDNPQRVISLGNAASWAKAEASLVLKGPVSDEVFAKRRAACSGCPELATDTEPKDAIGFCKACGCGTGGRAALTVKLTMPDATCPLKKW